MRDVLIFPHEHRTTLNLGIFPCIDCNPAKPTEGFSYISNTLLGTNIIFHPKACLSRAFSFSQSWGSVSSLEGSCICKTKLETDSSSLAIWIEIMQTKGYVHNIYIYHMFPSQQVLNGFLSSTPKRCAALGWSWTMAWRTRRSGRLRLGFTTAGKCWSKRWEGITSQNLKNPEDSKWENKNYKFKVHFLFWKVFLPPFHVHR